MIKSVTVVDYGVGNLLSVQRALEHCGASVVVASSPSVIATAERVVLPGVGAFGDGMEGLRKHHLDDAIREFAHTQRPLLGICLGMQLLASVSEEFGAHRGLDIVRGRVRAIPRVSTTGTPLKAPHIGWSELLPTPNAVWSGTILDAFPAGASVYLVHSFAFYPVDDTDLIAYCDYGGHAIPMVIRAGAVTGCQFHPEKSGPAGLALLDRFMRE